MNGKISRINNFDLIRLLAALQVIFYHSSKHLHINNNVLTYVYQFLDYFPGVPIFFTISGFLIYRSFERRPNQIRQYALNRFLRIYPALWISFLVTFIILIIFNVINTSNIFSSELIAWILGQLTFLQFWNLDFMDEYGAGAPNGSLWTISVELQFYIILPFLFFLLQRFNKKYALSILLLLFIFSYCVNILGQYLSYMEIYPTHRILLGVSIFPYLLYFLLGVFMYKYFEKLAFLFIEKFWIWLVLYIIYFSIFSIYCDFYQIHDNTYWPNLWGLMGYVILSFLTIAAALTKPTLSKKLLKDNDISYGIYIYHMIVMNIFIELGFLNNFIILIIVIGVTIVLAYLSWILIEKPALRYKKIFSKKQKKI